MKKSLLALAALTAFAGAASAQSSVTLYGRVDLSLAKPIGTDDKQVVNGSGSRLGFRGVEDLGGGLSADFNIEHRFNADTGETTNPAKFWHARSTVGLKGGFGRIALGREYTPAFLYAQLAADPWGWDTVAAFAGTQTGGGIGTVRNDNTVNYQIGGGGFNFWGQIAEGTAATGERPMGFAVNYSAGPLYVAYGYEDPADAGDDSVWHYLTAKYKFGSFGLIGGLGTGTTSANTDRDHFILGATMALGAGELRAAVGKLKDDSTGTVSQKMGLGYHYSMSKRTTLYVDVAHEKEVADEKTGYDVGIKHNF